MDDIAVMKTCSPVAVSGGTTSFLPCTNNLSMQIMSQKAATFFMLTEAHVVVASYMIKEQITRTATGMLLMKYDRYDQFAG